MTGCVFSKLVMRVVKVTKKNLQDFASEMNVIKYNFMEFTSGIILARNIQIHYKEINTYRIVVYLGRFY